MRLVAAGMLAFMAVVVSAGLRAEPVNWQAQPVRLMVVGRNGNVICDKWRQEIEPGYKNSREGKAAPLLGVNIDGPWPDGLAVARRPTITPTFILLENGYERARLEGYPGADRFYPLIARMLQQAGIAE